jgi:GTP1/Obg family GTP-binding protein
VRADTLKSSLSALDKAKRIIEDSFDYPQRLRDDEAITESQIGSYDQRVDTVVTKINELKRELRKLAPRRR